MKTIVAVQVVAILILGVGAGWSQETIEEYTTRITAELAAVSPEAAQRFSEANEARERMDFPLAEAMYRSVLELVPEFHHAKRRLADAVLVQGRRDEALELTKEVFSVAQSPENRAVRIRALVGAERPSKYEVQEAVIHANKLIATPSLGPEVISAVCDAGIADNNILLLQSCVRRLEKLDPDKIPTYFYGWILAVSRGDLELTRVKLDAAREAGLDEASYQELMKATAGARSPMEKAETWGSRVGIAWLSGMILLLVGGFILSRVTMRAATAVANAPSGAPVGLSLSLRKVYRAVLWLTCGYYYLSLPLVIVLVIGLGAGAVLWMLSVGVIPLKLLVVIVGVVAVTLIAVARSVLIRPQQTDPGERLDLDSEPRLREVLVEVAQEVDTRQVDNVYLTPGAELAVMERGGLGEQMSGRAERCLILGVGVLEGMKLGPFKSILGHEYGHFSNRDTAGGGFALAVRRSILLSAYGMAEGGAAGWYNPAWIFLNGFNWVFLIVSQGASRLQEVLADRWAVLAYGAGQFERGLRHVIDRSIRFDARAGAMFEAALETEVVKIAPNFYSSPPVQPISEDDIEKAIETTIDAPTSLTDSHPSPAERFEAARSQLLAPTGDLSDSEEEVWSLFEDREEVERSMSRIIWQSTGMVSEGEIEVAYA